jgi:hypothetical protein
MRLNVCTCCFVIDLLRERRWLIGSILLDLFLGRIVTYLSKNSTSFVAVDGVPLVVGCNIVQYIIPIAIVFLML